MKLMICLVEIVISRSLRNYESLFLCLLEFQDNNEKKLKKEKEKIVGVYRDGGGGMAAAVKVKEAK
jgi:hypothetical protein